MTLRHLQIFAKVCQCMSMSEAASELYISQSAVSQSIRELEGYYELSLFTRDHRKLQLTHAGEKLLIYARRMMELSDSVDRCMRETKIAPELRLGVTAGLGEHFLPGLLRRYQQNHGASQIVVHCESPGYIEQALLSNELDLALFEGPTRSSGFQSYELFTDPLRVVCDRDSRLSPLLQGETPCLTCEELFSLPLMLPARNSAAHSVLLPLLRQWGVPLHLPSLFSDYGVLCACVKQDLGVGVLPACALGNAAGLKVVQVAEWSCQQKICLIHHQKRFLFRQLQEFLDFILEDVKREIS